MSTPTACHTCGTTIPASNNRGGMKNCADCNTRLKRERRRRHEVIARKIYSILDDPGPGAFAAGAEFSAIEIRAMLENGGFNPGTLIQARGRRYRVEEQKLVAA